MPLEVDTPMLEFTLPTQEMFGQHLVDHDYAQTRYFDIYDENNRDICEGEYLHIRLFSLFLSSVDTL